MWHVQSIATCFLVLDLASCPVAAQEKPLAQPFVPGEVVVKFSPTSKAAALVAGASASSDQPNAPLASYVDSLAREVGIPIGVKRLGSGGMLIVSIQRANLVARLLERLRANPHVKEAGALSAAPPPPLVAQGVVQVEFAERSPEAEAVAKIAASGRETGPELDPIIKGLEHDSGIPSTARITSSRQILLSVDLSALTLDLAARLRKCADVEYAQPNFIRRRMSSAGPSPPPHA
jgi:hypothetical protein